ncbi:ATP-binding protein [Brevibacillus ruminantium]|uniref:ATP-binding protein n=1 Tax=Brevibacillus ruminantium TaxID=2950604 RepID=A0ABY4WHN1_9BACL|nr:ATP-binding protein [Brevibacillus ruminantium]USG66645.1 ATP-binding protein [Brevibacillus ruminantium]
MGRKLDEQQLERTKLFVGRNRELGALREWLDDPEAPFRVYSISGMGGIGKTSLMAEMLQTAKKRDVTGIWLDGRFCAPTPVGFLDYVSATVGLEKWEQPLPHPLQPFWEASPQRRIILCIDNFESVTLLEGWLLEVFFPKLPAQGIAIVLASRPSLSPAWKTHPAWGRQIVELPLSHFSFEETVAFLASTGSFRQELAGEMARATDGHPLSLALNVEAALRQKSWSVRDNLVVSQTISAHLLRELTLPELQPMVDVLITLQHANQEMLSLVLDEPVTVHQYQSLQGMSFIQTEPDGLALHDVARMHLLRDFGQREPQRLDDLRNKAASILYQKLQSAERGKRRSIASQLLLLCKSAFPLDKLYFDFSADTLISPMQQIQASDLPALHELLRHWCSYSVDPWQSEPYYRFLDEIAIHFPESIVVIRGDDGQPVGMFITVLLHKETSRILARYFPAEIQECCTPEELSCEPDQADTYFAVLGTATDQLPGYTREELVGLLTLDRLSLLGEGTRAVLVATNPDLKMTLQQLGFRLRPTRTRDCDTSFAQADVLELDLRQERFGDWAMSFFRQPEPLHTATDTALVTEKQVRSMLSSLLSPAELHTYVEYFPEMVSGAQLQKHLLSLIEGQLEGLSQTDQQLLKAAYVTHANNMIAAALACNMSRATFYRHLRSAVSHLAWILNH